MGNGTSRRKVSLGFLDISMDQTDSRERWRHIRLARRKQGAEAGGRRRRAIREWREPMRAVSTLPGHNRVSEGISCLKPQTDRQRTMGIDFEAPHWHRYRPIWGTTWRPGSSLSSKSFAPIAITNHKNLLYLHFAVTSSNWSTFLLVVALNT